MNRPLRPDDVRKYIQQIVNEQEPVEEDRGLRGAVTGYFNRVMGDENRKIVAGWLFAEEGEPFTPLSFKPDSMTSKQVYALSRWVGAYKDEEINMWLTHPVWVTEAHAVMGTARFAYHKPEPLSLTDTAVRQLGGIITAEHEDLGEQDEG